MKRLTEKHYGADDYYMKCSEECERDHCIDCPAFEALVDRLGAYEDTGLEPEEVLPKAKADEIALKLMRLADLESLCSYTSLRELAKADKDGRVVVLPCKVGGEVYSTLDDIGRLHRCRVLYVSIGEKQHLNWAALDPVDYNGSQYGASFRAFGKTVFFTREEAEEALRRADG